MSRRDLGVRPRRCPTCLAGSARLQERRAAHRARRVRVSECQPAGQVCLHVDVSREHGQGGDERESRKDPHAHPAHRRARRGGGGQGGEEAVRHRLRRSQWCRQVDVALEGAAEPHSLPCPSLPASPLALCGSSHDSQVAYYIRSNGYTPMLCACDTFRSGAVEQLRVRRDAAEMNAETLSRCGPRC